MSTTKKAASRVGSGELVRRLWRVEFQTGFVQFESVIADEAFARRWALKSKGAPSHERITKVTSVEAPPNDKLRDAAT